MLALFFATIASSQEAIVSLNNMERPKTELFYSREIPNAGDTLYLKVIVPSGWHINSNKVPDEFLIPSNVEPVAKGIEFAPAVWPEPDVIYNEVLNLNLLLLQDSFTIALPINSISNSYNPYHVKLKFTYQACSRICLSPKTIEVSFDDVLGESSQVSQKKNSYLKSLQIDKHSLFVYILLALLGGLILNVMPCVLPVLFLKIFDIAKRAGENKRNILKWGFATAGGVYFSFAIIAIFVLAARASGNALGWGFQFQHPAYTAAMAICLAVFALNLWGVFEIWMPGNALKVWEKHAKKGGFYGAFVYGIFLVLLSTPCSAPFLGTAIGFAFTASAPELLAVFASLATGLCLPYIFLSTFPAWTKIIPRPGHWMTVFKQALGFPLLLTLVWLVWVFYKQAGADASIVLVLLVCASGFFAWLSRLLSNPGKPWWRFVVLWMVFVSITVWVIYRGYPYGDVGSGGDEDAKYGEWIPFSEKTLDSLQNEGAVIWVNGTADWCITCKVNERSVFENERVRDAFGEMHVVKVRADYTNSNEEALKLFEAYGRRGVPFDLLLIPQHEPLLLPEFLQTDMVMEALEAAR